MRHTVTSIILCGLTWLAVGRADAQSDILRMTARVVPDTYIVTFRSDTWQRSHLSLHASFYRNLTAWSVKWTTVREYRDPILSGVVIKIRNATDVTRLAEGTGVESVDPVRAYSPSNATRSSSVRMSKRLAREAYPWYHAVTGVRELHSAGHFGQGVTIGIIDSGIDYNHVALGAGMGLDKKVVGGHAFVGDEFTGRDDSPLQPSDDPLDTCFGHGTFVAGIIGANPGHRRDLVGVAHEAKLNAYRISGCSGVQRDDVTIDAFLRAHRDSNDVITYASEHRGGWGWGPLAMTVKKIAAQGRVIVAGSGNQGEEGSWHSTDIGYHPGIIIVGFAEMARSAIVPEAVIMAKESALGPTTQLHFSPAISAPGIDLISTMPVGLGLYDTVSGASVAAPYMAGAVALLLQVKGADYRNALDIRQAFQNTALHMHQRPRENRLVDTVSHQGAGLIQVHRAALTKATMHPAELLLNDTIYAVLSWRVSIRNMGLDAVTYTLRHEPAGTAPTKHGIDNIRGSPTLLSSSATLRMSAEQVKVPPSQTRTIRIQFQPPTGLDPTTFPIYSGYIKAAGSDGTVLQSVYLGLGASMKEMKILDDVSTISGVRFPFVIDRNGDAVLQPRTFTMRDKDIPKLVYRRVSSTALLRLDLIATDIDMATVMRRDVRSLKESSRKDIGRSTLAERRLGDCPPCVDGRPRSRGALRRGIRLLKVSKQTNIAGLALAKRTFWNCIFSASGRNLGRGGRSNSGSGRGNRWFGRLDSSRSRSHSGSSSFGRFFSSTDRGSFNRIPIVGTIAERTYIPRHYRSGPGELQQGHSVIRVAQFRDGGQIPDGNYRLLLRALKNFGDARYQEDYEVWTSIQITIRRT